MSTDIAALADMVRHEAPCRANVMRGNYDLAEAAIEIDALITAPDNAIVVLT